MPDLIQNAFFQTSDRCAIAYTLRLAANALAPRIVLIHSLALDGGIWDGVVQELAGRAATLTYDCRGHGRSGRHAAGYTPELFARDLKELLDSLEWRKVIVAGCSMGGCVAQAFAGLNPARVSALLLIDTTAWYGEDAPVKWRERAATARKNGLGGMAEFQVTRWFGDDFRAKRPELVKTALDVFMNNDVDCYAASCEMLGDADLRRYLPSLRMAVSIIVGEEDFATPVAASRQLHEAIPGSTLKILPGARHLTPIECPEEIAANLLVMASQSLQDATAE